MTEKTRQIVDRYEFLEHSLALPEILSDAAKYSSMMKEYNSLCPVVEVIRRVDTWKKQMADAEEMMRGESDPELRQMAQMEFYDLRESLAEAEIELRKMLIPRDPNDDKNVVMEIRAGTGGEEAALFAADLYRMYIMYAEAHGFRCEIAEINETELGGYKKITFLVSGSGAYSRFKFESGAHRVQRVPVTESSGRLQTSAATVAVLPEAEDVQIEINPADLQIEAMKSSGAGGQHINKTLSAIRLIHKPSGIVIECQDERSQLRNKEKALRLLRARLYEEKQRSQNDQIASERKSQVGSGDRSGKIRTYNFREGRVTDHRIGLTLYTLDSVMNGDLDGLIDALTAADMEEKLKESDREA